MSRYAEQTSVAAERSRAEIEGTLTRYGATAFMYGWGSTAGEWLRPQLAAAYERGPMPALMPALGPGDAS